MPNFAAISAIAPLPKTLEIWSAEIGKFAPVPTHEAARSPKPPCLNLSKTPFKPRVD